MARIKEVIVISDKYEHNIKKGLNALCKKYNVQNIQITMDTIGFYQAFVMIGSNEDGKKKK